MNKIQNFVYLASARVSDSRLTDTKTTGYATSMKISEGVNVSECEHRRCVYFEVFHAIYSYICRHLELYQLKAQCLFFTYTNCNSPTCFSAMCTIISENHYAIYLKPDIVIKLLNIVSIAVVS
jgi:hypothetical protein